MLQRAGRRERSLGGEIHFESVCAGRESGGEDGGDGWREQRWMVEPECP